MSESEEAGQLVAGREPGLERRPVVLVGLMGAGKTAVGKRLAGRFGVEFIDADRAIEEAAGCTVPDIFERWGEPEFRRLEQAVISRILASCSGILSTGGGAFINPATRALIKRVGISIWLRARKETLLGRTARRSNRPLLQQGDPAQVLGRLIEERYPLYAEADIMVDTRDVPLEQTVDKVLEALQDFDAAWRCLSVDASDKGDSPR